MNPWQMVDVLIVGWNPGIDRWRVPHRSGQAARARAQQRLAVRGVAPHRIGQRLRLWAVPLIFIAACFVTRINGADDIRLITNNLTYALLGDDGPA